MLHEKYISTLNENVNCFESEFSAEKDARKHGGLVVFRLKSAERHMRKTDFNIQDSNLRIRTRNEDI